MAISKNFVVKNGIEVAENLIYTEGQSVGIGTTLPEYLLSVNGNLSLSGGVYLPNDTPTVKTATGIVSTTSLVTISGINTSSLFVGDYVTGEYIQSNTRITAIGSSSLSILPNHTNSSGIATTSFTFFRYKVSGNSGQVLTSQGDNLPPTWGFPGQTETAINVIGGIGSITELSVSGISTFNDLVSIAQTADANALQINNYSVLVNTGQIDSTSGLSSTIHSYSFLPGLEYKVSEYTLNVQNGANIQAQKILVIQNSTQAYMQEYGVIFNNAPIVSVGVTIVGSEYQLQLTPENGVSGIINYRFIRGGLQ